LSGSCEASCLMRTLGGESMADSFDFVCLAPPRGSESSYSLTAFPETPLHGRTTAGCRPYCGGRMKSHFHRTATGHQREGRHIGRI
jgi:hypothetical protein